MRLFACLMVAIVATSSLFSQTLITTVPTATRPVCLIADGDRMHVLTDQIDLNYNGAKDDGDSEATWQIVNATTYESIRTLTFPWTWVRASRPVIDRATGLLYIAVGDTVWAYTTLTQQRSSEPVFIGPATALGLHPDNDHLYVAQRTSFTEPGTVVDVNLIDRSTTSATVEVNPQMTIGHRGAFIPRIAITVNEGNFGAGDGTLTFWDGTNVLTLGVGDTPNHLYVNPDAPSTGYVTCNGSHNIVVVELDGRYAIDTFALPTSGYDGPREATMFDGVLYVSTYAGTVIALNAVTGEWIYTLETDAKIDALTFYQNALWVARSYEKGGYSPVPNVNVYDIRLTSVRDAIDRTTERRAILVTQPTVSVPALNAERPLTLINLQGASTSARVVDRATATVSVEGMAPGVYVLSDGTTSIVLMLPGSVAAG